MKNDGFSQDGYRPREVESVLRVVARSVSSPIADLMNQHLSISPPHEGNLKLMITLG